MLIFVLQCERKERYVTRIELMVVDKTKKLDMNNKNNRFLKVNNVSKIDGDNFEFQSIYCGACKAYIQETILELRGKQGESDVSLVIGFMLVM